MACVCKEHDVAAKRVFDLGAGWTGGGGGK